MSNFGTIMGGVGWALVSLLLISAALEPVTVESGTPALQMAAAQAPQQYASA